METEGGHSRHRRTDQHAAQRPAQKVCIADEISIGRKWLIDSRLPFSLVDPIVAAAFASLRNDEPAKEDSAATMQKSREDALIDEMILKANNVSELLAIADVTKVNRKQALKVRNQEECLQIGFQAALTFFLLL